jgi:hypothetical protein
LSTIRKVRTNFTGETFVYNGSSFVELFWQVSLFSNVPNIERSTFVEKSFGLNSRSGKTMSLVFLLYLVSSIDWEHNLAYFQINVNEGHHWSFAFDAELCPVLLGYPLFLLVLSSDMSWNCSLNQAMFFLFYFRNAVYNLFSLVHNGCLCLFKLFSSFVSIRFIFFSYEIRPWLIQSMADTWQMNSEECLSYKYLLKSFKSCFWCSEVTHFAHTYYFVNL